MNTQPTVFHITHHKAGSQWVAEVLKQCTPERILWPKNDLSFFYNRHIKPHSVYLTMYVPRLDFEIITTRTKIFNREICQYILQHPGVYIYNWFNFGLLKKPCRKIIIIRDLRDTLVSLYFSWKISHTFTLPWQHRCRKILNRVNEEQGLLYFIGQGEISRFDGKLASPFLKNHYDLANYFDDTKLVHWMSKIFDYLVNIQLSWLYDDALHIKYEELLMHEYTAFEQMIDYCQIDVSRQRLHEVIHYNTFKEVTGRQRGQEDITAHQRKGIAGDWCNHFSENVKEEFKKRFGDVLIKTGYEDDVNW